MGALVVIGAVVQLATLIVFFVLAFNVSKIKDSIVKPYSGKQYLSMADEEKYIGNKDKAKEYLMRAKYRYETGLEQYSDGDKICSSEYICSIINRKISEL